MSLFDLFPESTQKDNNQPNPFAGFATPTKNDVLWTDTNSQSSSLFAPKSPHPVVPRNGVVTDDLIHSLSDYTETVYNKATGHLGKAMALHDYGAMGTVLQDMTKVVGDLDVSTIQKNRNGLLGFLKRTYDDVKSEILARTSTAESAISKAQDTIRAETNKMREFQTSMGKICSSIFDIVADLNARNQTYIDAAKSLNNQIQEVSQRNDAKSMVNVNALRTQLHLVEEGFRRHLGRIQQLELQAFDCQTSADNSRKLVFHASSFMQQLPDIMYSVRQYSASLSQGRFAQQLQQIAGAHNKALVMGNKAVNDTAVSVDTLLSNPIVSQETIDTMRQSIATAFDTMQANRTQASESRKQQVQQQQQAHAALLEKISK